MIEEQLKLWIAQSGSWETFVDFKMPKEDIARYTFYERPTDFYVSLFGKIFDLLPADENGGQVEDLTAVARGLDIFSIESTRGEFKGVNWALNALYSGALYYLADYSATAYIRAKSFNLIDYQEGINQLLWSFLSRDLSPDTEYVRRLRDYLYSGNPEHIQAIFKATEHGKVEAFESNPFSYVSFFIAEEVFKKFSSNNIWVDLLHYNTKNYWEKYVLNNLRRDVPLWDYFPSQRRALESGILSEEKSFTLKMPTSSGKTAICELVVYDEIKKRPGRKVLFLAPYRALANELKLGFAPKLGKYGIKSKTIYGGNIPTKEEKADIDEVDLLIATPEKFIAVENVFGEISSQFSTIICDEGHLLDSEERGLSYELLLSRFKTNQENGKRFLFLSAIIPNLNAINNWLGGSEETVVSSDYRPTRLDFAVLQPESVKPSSFRLVVNPTEREPVRYFISKFLTGRDFKYISLETGRENTYPYYSIKPRVVAVALKSLHSGVVALFSPHKRGNTGVEGLAEELITQVSIGLQLPKPLDFADRGRVVALKDYFNQIFGGSYLLTRLVDYGVLVHHGDLPQNVREVVEDSINSGDVKLVICTNTLAEGVNLPIKTLVLYSTKRYDPATRRQKPLLKRDLKNLCGRAGRAGKEPRGLVIVVNPRDFEENIKPVILEERMENVLGYLYRIVTLIHGFLKRNKLELSNELIAGQHEFFKRWIDAIDISIIRLLPEDVPAERVEEFAESLIRETFAYTLLGDEFKETLRKLITVRTSILGEYIADGRFKSLKGCGANLRNFGRITEVLDIENPIWIETEDPFSETWFNYIQEIIGEIPYISALIEEFNERNRTGFDLNDIFKASRVWMAGGWFQEVAEILNTNVDIILNLFSSFIGYHLQMVLSNIIRVAEIELENVEKNISLAVLHWPLFVQYGLCSEFELALINLGFIDRIGIKAISEWFKNTGRDFTDILDLRDFITKREPEILGTIEGVIPEISFEKTKKNLGFLKSEETY